MSKYRCYTYAQNGDTEGYFEIDCTKPNIRIYMNNANNQDIVLLVKREDQEELVKTLEAAAKEMRKVM